MAPPALRIIPLGGLGEIGKNMMALEYEDDIVVVDCGVMFPEEDMPGVDLVIPDVTYLKERVDNVRGILITHGHEDHIGALAHVLPDLPVPVYAPPLAHGLIAVKLREHHRLRNAELHVVEPGRRHRMGAFQVEWFRVCHSIPDAMGIAIHTPLGVVVHTGDFKLDHTPVDGKRMDLAKLASLGRDGVFLLCSDSTYAERPGYTPSEAVLRETLARAVGEAPGRVLVATFASLISRVQLVIDAAVAHGRKVAIAGRSMVDNVQMSMKMGYLNIPEGVLVDVEATRHLAPEKVVLITTGSQGEPTSVLVRIANNEHRELRIVRGDTVIISASPIPGNELVVSRTIDNLYRLGARVLYYSIATVHVHGHGSQEELKLMLNLTRPKYFVPVHGEYRHLVAHARLADAVGIPQDRVFVLEDGDVLELTAEGGRVAERVKAGHVFVDGSRLWEEGGTVIRDRRSLQRDGVVIVTVAVDRSLGMLAAPPEVRSSGFTEDGSEDTMLQRAADALAEALGHDGALPRDRRQLEQKVKEVVGRFLFAETRRRPMILPVTLDV